MDSLTHVVLGAVTGELLAGKKLGKKAMLWGALANSLPDIDVACMAFMNIPDELLAHRGFTHSFLFAFLAAPLLAAGLNRSYRKQHAGYKTWFVFLLAEILLHDVVDSMTAYGTGLLEPFSHRRFSFDLVFVADPFFTLPLLVAFLRLAFRATELTRRRWARVCLGLSGLYVLFAMVNKIHVDRVLDENLTHKQMTGHRYMTTPTPFNNLLWYVVVVEDSGYSIAHYSLFDKTDALVFYFVPRNDSLRITLEDDADLKKLIRFSQGYYCLTREQGQLYFSDMRFGQVGGWFMPDAPFVFRYQLAKDANNDLVIQRGRAKASEGKALQEMIHRIFRDRRKPVDS